MEQSVLALVVVVGVLVPVWALVRTVRHVRQTARTPYEAAPSPALLAVLAAHALTSFAAAYFWLCWLVAIYLLASVKLPRAPGAAPLPSAEALAAPVPAGLLAAVVAAYAVRIALLVHAQCTVDIFFLDWERPRSASAARGGAADAAVAAATMKEKVRRDMQHKTFGR